MNSFPTTGPRRVLGLLVALAGASVRSDGDPRRELHDWVRAQAARHSSDDFVVSLAFKNFLVVGSAELSSHILGQTPVTDGFVAGELKTKAMSYLAPSALTISNDEAWRRRRSYNEQILSPGRPHDLRSRILVGVHDAFSTPVASLGEVRRRMARVMLAVDFGGTAPDSLATDVDRLFGLVQNPLKRVLLGRINSRRKRRFYDELRVQWDEASADSLVGIARASGAGPSAETLEQIPHWMFPFTTSGSELAARTLALVGSRPGALERVRSEIDEASSLDDPDAVATLEFLEACIWEAGRLFAPVPHTFHAASSTTFFGDREIPAGIEIVHYFPISQRDISSDPTADDFRPDRWLEPGSDAKGRYPNLFLSGARECPGRDLILFVMKAALARQLGPVGLRAEAPRLSQDPLPLSFPAREIRLYA